MPDPEACEHSITSYYPSLKTMKQEYDFFKLSLQIALNKTHEGYGIVASLKSMCQNNREEAAWDDCHELLNDVILQLDRIISTPEYISDDAETLISAALTNLDTCRYGFMELGVTNNIYPLLPIKNVSELIFNTLALNNLPHRGSSNYEDGFPTWVKPNDQKLLQDSSSLLSSQETIVVANDNLGDFNTITEAINYLVSLQMNASKRKVIHIKQGIYRGSFIKLKNVMLVGAGISKTIFIGNKNVARGGITGDGFIAKDITFRNTAGERGNQAVALLAKSDHSVFYRCSFEGYQDTLYAHSYRQFYRECNIYGTVDFIFGNAAAVFQNCGIYVARTSRPTCTITAQNRLFPKENTGFSIHDSTIDMHIGGTAKCKGYFGRPWGKFSRVVILKSFLGPVIDKVGWLPWSGKFALDTLYYAEYRNHGPGASLRSRVTWPGYHRNINEAVARKFTVRKFISGTSWLPSTGVPFTIDL
ncbi:pectinesterase 2-like [Malania oleifera]|uniref:pectinesterase 2-like n=1 Tax=Malania oleifera TaxID=397392 RepID=UPI0025ADDC3B|nr:pectinesterase 2-like [Malania oleifera]